MLSLQVTCLLLGLALVYASDTSNGKPVVYGTLEPNVLITAREKGVNEAPIKYQQHYANGIITRSCISNTVFGKKYNFNMFYALETLFLNPEVISVKYPNLVNKKLYKLIPIEDLPNKNIDVKKMGSIEALVLAESRKCYRNLEIGIKHELFLKTVEIKYGNEITLGAVIGPHLVLTVLTTTMLSQRKSLVEATKIQHGGKEFYPVKKCIYEGLNDAVQTSIGLLYCSEVSFMYKFELFNGAHPGVLTLYRNRNNLIPVDTSKTQLGNIMHIEGINAKENPLLSGSPALVGDHLFGLVLKQEAGKPDKLDVINLKDGGVSQTLNECINNFHEEVITEKNEMYKRVLPILDGDKIKGVATVIGKNTVLVVSQDHTKKNITVWYDGTVRHSSKCTSDKINEMTLYVWTFENEFSTKFELPTEQRYSTGEQKMYIQRFRNQPFAMDQRSYPKRALELPFEFTAYPSYSMMLFTIGGKEICIHEADSGAAIIDGDTLFGLIHSKKNSSIQAIDLSSPAIQDFVRGITSLIETKNSSTSTQDHFRD